VQLSGYGTVVGMELFQVDDSGRLFISPAINEVSDWDLLNRYKVDTVIDLEGDIDIGFPTVPNQYLYIYLPILDEELPSLGKLQALGSLGASVTSVSQEAPLLR
jgi:hypothetical protein